MSFFNKSIKKRLMASCTLLVSIPIVILGISNYNSARVQVYQGAEEMIHQHVLAIAQNAENTYELVQKKVKSDLKVARYILNAYGKPDINASNELILVDEKAETLVQKKVASDLIIAHSMLYSGGKPEISKKKQISVEAVNQMTRAKRVLKIPVMSIGNRQLAFNYDLVDRITETSGVQTATIFQTIPGGLLRISTNVRKLDGKRAVGTYIPETSAVYKTVMNRKTFYGRAWVVNAWYKTAYEPILDDQQRVIGVLYVGEKESTHIVNNNFEIVDKIRNQIGGTATIFQLKKVDRTKESNKAIRDWKGNLAMYRVSTNVKKLNGKRATGTIVSKPVFDAVMKGETYYGRAWVVNDWYTTAYEPLKDSSGKICGILYVGVKESNYQSVLLSQLSRSLIGKRGYVMILNEKGDYILSPEKSADGKNIMGLLDSDGMPFIQEIVKLAQDAKNSRPSHGYYAWRGETDSGDEEKLMGFTAFKGWGWTIIANAYVDDFTSGLNRIALMTLFISLGAILLGVLVSYYISASFIKPINRIVAFISELSSCRFSSRIEIESEDEIGIIADALNTTVQSLEEAFSSINSVIEGLEKGDLTRETTDDLQGDLDEIGHRINTAIQMFREMIGQVVEKGDQFSHNAEEMSELANEMSAGSTQQATSLEEITTSMGEVGEQARNNEQNAEQTQELTDHARSEVQNGNHEMSAMIETMHNIQNASLNVSKVIQVINGIASKTELLALNAAVEAARAGAHGKGFAVVAEEIRSLANRSTEAAKNTAKLIQDSLDEVERGVQMSDRTAQALETIDKRVEEISAVIQQILHGSHEQSLSFEEISKALSQVNTVVQNNTSISEQTADASLHLSEQATGLKEQMKQFKLM